MLVMDFCSEGDLKGYFNKHKGPFHEDFARFFLCQLGFVFLVC